MTLRKLWWMAAGRWDFQTGVLAGTLAAAMGKDAPNPFGSAKTIGSKAKTEAEIEHENRVAWAIFDQYMRGGH